MPRPRDSLGWQECSSYLQGVLVEGSGFLAASDYVPKWFAMNLLTRAPRSHTREALTATSRTMTWRAEPAHAATHPGARSWMRVQGPMGLVEITTPDP